MAQREVEVVCGSLVFPVAFLLTLLSVSCHHKENTVNSVVTADYTVHIITCCTLHLSLLFGLPGICFACQPFVKKHGCKRQHTPDTYSSCWSELLGKVHGDLIAGRDRPTHAVAGLSFCNEDWKERATLPAGIFFFSFLFTDAVCVYLGLRRHSLTHNDTNAHMARAAWPKEEKIKEDKGPGWSCEGTVIHYS